MHTDGMPRKPNYNVKKVETILVGTDVQARMFTLAPADVIPWHHHTECADHYFVLQGALTIETRNPDDRRALKVGDRHEIIPGTAHLLSNRGTVDCQFLLLQGVGKYDWNKAEG
jgi:mannose-6-phosphate isomerase-like protein (cupin superfamily)